MLVIGIILPIFSQYRNNEGMFSCFFKIRVTQILDEDTIEYNNSTSESTDYKYFQGISSDDPTTVKYETISTNNYNDENTSDDDEITSDDDITTLYSETTSDDILTITNNQNDISPVKYETEGIFYIFIFSEIVRFFRQQLLR